MNTNPGAKVILCYGDSNVYGQKPDKIHRYPADVRWTGQLQNLLGNDYYIIEEGLGSRTTDLDYDKKPGRNGKAYLAPCLQSHNPLDAVVIMLGTNDLKLEYGRTAGEIASALAGLVDDVREFSRYKARDSPKIILASPTIINNEAPNFTKFYTDYYDSRSVSESKKLAEAISNLATQLDCYFIDATSVAENGDEGVHWDEPSQSRFAKALEPIVRQSA